MSLNFREKRQLQKTVTEQQAALRGGGLGFKDKRQAQRLLREALDKLTGKGSAPASSGSVNIDDMATRLVTPDTLPESLPARDGVIVMNAPRPLLGNETAEGDFASGRFYAAIDLKGEDAARFIEQNRKLDAIILYPASRDVIEQVAIALAGGKYAARLGELDADKQVMQIEQWIGNLGDRPYAEIKRAVESAQGAGSAVADPDMPASNDEPETPASADSVTLTAQAVRGDFNDLALPEFIDKLKAAYGADEDLDGAKDAAVAYLEANRAELEEAA